jgi:hypothetical protein
MYSILNFKTAVYGGLKNLNSTEFNRNRLHHNLFAIKSLRNDSFKFNLLSNIILNQFREIQSNEKRINELSRKST